MEFPDFIEAIKKNTGYIDKVNSSVAELEKHFEEIKKHIGASVTNDNYNAVYQCFFKIFEIIPLMKLQITSHQLVRGRPHFKGDSLCGERWQLSYNWRFRHYIKLGRFNREGEPLFYASVPTESKEVDYVLSCSLECCKELSIQYPVDVQDITISGWLIKEPFFVINLCFDDLHLAANPQLREATNKHLTSIKEVFSFQAAEFIEKFFRYFSALSRTIKSNNEAYLITSTIFVVIREFYKSIYGEEIYGLIYPSAMTMAKGLNVVLTREAVKNFLKLDKVVMFRYVLGKPERNSYVGDTCSDLVYVKNHKFKITGYVPPGR